MKKALLSAGLMLMFSVTMLLGTTYAWWSEEIVVRDNTITTGKLEMTAEFKDPNVEMDWVNFEDGNSLFEVTNLQPGFVTTREVKVTNDGTIPMAFKVSAIHGTAQYGDRSRTTDVQLSQALQLTVKLNERHLYTGGLPSSISSPYIVLEKGESITFTVTLTIPTTLEDCEGMEVFFPITFEAEQVARVQSQQLFDELLNPIQ